jgi:ABC-type transport system involved in multi-copper enzyme maturation permease subunit
MKTTSSSLAVFLWTFRRKWRGYTIFLTATALLIFAIIGLYPEFAELRGKAMAEALGGDMEVALTKNDEQAEDYTLTWSKYGGADGYVVVESDSEIPLPLIKSLGASGVNLPLMATLVPGDGKLFFHPFDANTNRAELTGLDEKYGSDDPVVHFGVLAFEGGPAAANIVGTSHSVNTQDMIAEGAYDKMMENPFIKSLVGSRGADIYSIRGFVCLELFGSLMLYVIIYFLVQYAGAFSLEMENKTIDLLLSTALTRRRLFASRYLAWVGMNLVLIVSWTAFIYAGVLLIEEGDAVSLADVAWTMFLFLPFLLAVQGTCMLVSVVVNESRKAYGICFGIYYGMHAVRILAPLSERLKFLERFTIMHYVDYESTFIDGFVPWLDVAVLTLLSVALFVAGLVIFDRKDLVC